MAKAPFSSEFSKTEQNNKTRTNYNSFIIKISAKIKKTWTKIALAYKNFVPNSSKHLEATAGIEPAHNSFADCRVNQLRHVANSKCFARNRVSRRMAGQTSLSNFATRPYCYTNKKRRLLQLTSSSYVSIANKTTDLLSSLPCTVADASMRTE